MARKKQLTSAYKKKLEHQQYRTIGTHSAVKVCGWTKQSLRGAGECYKKKFYGIKTHKCLQMTCNLSCANRCIFCWRDDKGPVEKEWEWQTDEPEEIAEKAIEEHLKLLIGFAGSDTAKKKKVDESKKVEHVALSLIGEPIQYPKINELVKEFHKRKISTFVVTNGQYPKAIKNLKKVTQLYLSIDAPNRETAKIIGVPLFKDHWKRFNRSLEEIAKKKYRTAARITIVHGINDFEPGEYANLVKKGKFDFVEVKDYVHVGASRKRLKKENMALMKGIRKFSKELAAYLPDYEIVSEHRPSKVVLLAKKKFKGNTKIDFKKLFSASKSRAP